MMPVKASRLRKRSIQASVALTVIVMTVTACSSGKEGGKNQPRIAVVASLSGDPYYLQVACGAKSRGKELGLKVDDMQAPKTLNQAEESTIVQSVLSNKPDALIYTPADPVAGGLPIRTARQDDVTVVNVDAQLENQDLYDTFVASDHAEGGAEVARYLAKAVGGAGQIAAVGILPTNPITQARIKGFNQAMKAYPDIKVVSITYPDLSPEAIQANAAATLVKYPDLRGIYTTSFLNSTGAAVAIRNAKKVGKVKMVSWDAGAPNVKLLQEGVLQATVAQQPFRMGELAVEAIDKKLKGQPIGKVENSPVSLLTSEAVDTPDGKKLWYRSSC